jgi:hypothetical protein
MNRLIRFDQEFSCGLMLQSRVTLEAPAQAELRPTCAGLAALPPPRRAPRQISRSIRIAWCDARQREMSTGNFMWAHATERGDTGSPGSGRASPSYQRRGLPGAWSISVSFSARIAG